MGPFVDMHMTVFGDKLGIPA